MASIDRERPRGSSHRCVLHCKWIVLAYKVVSTLREKIQEKRGELVIAVDESLLMDDGRMRDEEKREKVRGRGEEG